MLVWCFSFSHVAIGKPGEHDRYHPGRRANYTGNDRDFIIMVTV